jgi:hypothetical protein
MKAKDRSGKWKSLILLLAIIPQLAIAQSVGEPDVRTTQEKAKLGEDRAALERAHQEGVNQSHTITNKEEAARQKAISAGANHYSAAKRYANWLDQATNRVPSPSTFSDLYLKQLGVFKVSCQTNRRSGTIDYRVDGCQTTNINAVFASVRQMPNRVRVSQGSNSVSVAIRLPTQ